MGRQTHTRERLVRTGGELFWRQGYAQTGVSSIMKKARATSGSFYHFFPTKDDLLLAVLDAVAELISTEVLGSAESASEDPTCRVAILIETYRARTAPDASGFGIPLGTLVGELGPDHGAALIRVEQIYEILISRIAGWFIDGDHRWDGSVDPRRLAEFVVAVLEGASMMAVAGRRTAPFDACAEELQLRLESLAIGGSPCAEEMPPPDPSATGAGDWKAW